LSGRRGRRKSVPSQPVEQRAPQADGLSGLTLVLGDGGALGAADGTLQREFAGQLERGEVEARDGEAVLAELETKLRGDRMK